jgi:hypothetical protein
LEITPVLEKQKIAENLRKHRGNRESVRRDDEGGNRESVRRDDEGKKKEDITSFKRV